MDKEEREERLIHAQTQHLRACLSPSKHATYREQRAAATARQRLREAASQRQESEQLLAAWTLLGSKDQQLWLLDVPQLRDQARRRQVSGDLEALDKADLIALLVGESGEEREGERLSLCRAAASGESLPPASSSRAVVPAEAEGRVGRRKRGRGGGPQLLAEVMPSNLHGMHVDQLRELCASLGILSRVKKGARKADLLTELESYFFEAESNHAGDSRSNKSQLISVT